MGQESVDPLLSRAAALSTIYERGVKVFEPQSVREACGCSSERITNMLKGFSPQERGDMVGDNGKIGVTCEYVL